MYIKENALLARIAAARLKQDKMAMVLGRTILLYNTSRQEFLGHHSWRRHELAHVKQFRSHGYAVFIFKYIRESVRNGYYNNKYEREAREAESDESLDTEFEVV